MLAVAVVALGAALIVPSDSEEAARAIPTAQPAAPLNGHPAKEERQADFFEPDPDGLIVREEVLRDAESPGASS